MPSSLPNSHTENAVVGVGCLMIFVYMLFVLALTAGIILALWKYVLA